MPVNFKVTPPPIPPVVTSGLVVNYDASNATSYPGSGSTWSDLSGNGYNATLQNGPTFSSAYGGDITIDGSNDYISLPTTNILNTNADFTCDIAFTMLTGTANRNVLDGLQIGALVIRATNVANYVSLVRGDQLELGNFGSTSAITLNTPVVISLSLNKATTTFSLYVNGVFKNTLNPGNQTFTTTSPILGKHLCCYEFTNESFYNFKWYNRQLTSEEVLQNFNAVKTKLGL
jgi:hypothetical protein